MNHGINNHDIDPFSWILRCHQQVGQPFASSWWRHQMETLSALLAICAGIHRSPVNSQHKGQWRGALMFSLICVWITGWVNNREAGDLRRYRTHCDVTVMMICSQLCNYLDMIPEFWCQTKFSSQSVWDGAYFISRVEKCTWLQPLLREHTTSY